jgi:hypothetical protein
MDLLEKILDYVIKEEDRYYDLANEAMNQNNIFANQINVAQASAFQRVKYFIEMQQESK